MRTVPLLCFFALGCAAPVPLTWTVSVTDPSLCDDVVAYEASLERDGCGGEAVYAVTRFRGSSEALPTPSALSPGRWGFRVRARDSSCRFVADRCIERDLPSDQATLDVEITCGAAMELACAAALCESGVCVGTDPPPPPHVVWPPSAYATGSPHAPQATRLRWDPAPSANRYEVVIGAPCDTVASDCDLSSAPMAVSGTELALADVGLTRRPGGERRAWAVRSCRDTTCGPFSRPRVLAIDRLDGDLDGDGFADAVLGAPAVGGGRVGVLSGASAALGGAPSFVDPGLEASARFGSAAASADLDGDGRGDALVGAPFADTPAGGDAGLVFTLLGGGDPRSPASVAGSPAETFGASVAVVGDLDGDGYLDVAVGAPQFSAVEDDAGRVVLFYGSAAGLSGPAVITWDPAPSAAFGASVSGGDLDGDGFADLVVGEPGRTPAASAVEAGRVLVFRGGPAGVSATPDVIAPSSPQPSLRFGAAVEVLDDLDGDGIADLAVGAPGWDAGGTPDLFDGRVFVYSGSEAGVHTVPPQELANPFTGAGAAVGERFGAALSSGDLNGDGRSDLVVGAPNADPGGAALIYLSRGLSFDAAPSRFLDRGAPGGELGASIGVGDLDGDGVDDVCVIARAEERARFHLGEPGGPLAEPSFEVADAGLRGAVSLGR
ncbi:MAG: VCBS repeat-containing protein [Sandaracinaceae bacterium]|nr:VCBS repeat-containing protein [Sandaracinaceae bacterium]